MAFTVLVQTSLVSAEATVARLAERGIEAVLLDRPNVIAWLVSGGNYRTRVAVPEEVLSEAKAELASWEAEAKPRIAALARDVQRGLLLASLPAFVAAVAVAAVWPTSAVGWSGVAVLWLASLTVWGARSRSRMPRPPTDDPKMESGGRC